MDVLGKHIAVLGLARSGESVARLLHAKGAKVTVLDTGDSEIIQERALKLRQLGVTVKTGAEVVSDHGFTSIVLSPGIDPHSGFVKQFSEQGIPITGELEVAWSYCNKRVIAITGTNGKTTTTELITTMLNNAGLPTVACGNIGLPFSDVVAQMQDSLEVITLEVSSFQLETISTFAPRIALWLNFTPDHLDRYPSMQEYRDAKLRIFENQKSSDFAICNAADALPELRAKKITFSSYGLAADFSIQDNDVYFDGEPIAPLDSFQTVGLHNAENLMAALATGRILGIPFSRLLPSLQNYRPAPHRCELIAEIEGVRYINDSKSTNPDALAKAITSCTGRIILIAGGKDKGFEFGTLRELISTRVSEVILIGEMAERIQADWKTSTRCRIAATLEDAVYQAKSLSNHGDTVLFSPGTSSFDMFRDYADRGDQFRSIIQKLTHPQLV